MPCAHIAAATAVELLPQSLGAWVRRSIEQAVEFFESAESETPEFAAAARRLAHEVKALP
jgi:hypothetical protein